MNQDELSLLLSLARRYADLLVTRRYLKLAGEWEGPIEMVADDIRDLERTGELSRK